MRLPRDVAVRLKLKGKLHLKLLADAAEPPHPAQRKVTKLANRCNLRVHRRQTKHPQKHRKLMMRTKVDVIVVVNNLSLSNVDGDVERVLKEARNPRHL
ncbi:MAG: hypothetical protein OXM61_19680 [Candidatus Poribacteria bacterium]|nr:hypothetical protein [Candidatus Poribacteria bacterium]